MREVISYGRVRARELGPHKNRGMEISYVASGDMEWMVEGRPEKVPPGSVFFTLPWQVHGSMNPEEPENNILYHVLFHLKNDCPKKQDSFLLPDSFCFSSPEMREISSVLCTSKRHCFPATPTMRCLMPELVRELQGSHRLSEANIKTLLRAVLVELVRIVCGEAVNTEKYTYAEQRVQRFLPELSTSCDYKWTLHEMQEHCGIHGSQLNAIFQKLTGFSPIDYLCRLRLERSKTLLRDTDMKIIDIAFECGFGSSQYFSNTFHRSTGVSPSTYRNHFSSLTDTELHTWENIRFRSEREEQERIRRHEARE